MFRVEKAVNGLVMILPPATPLPLEPAHVGFWFTGNLSVGNAKALRCALDKAIEMAEQQLAHPTEEAANAN